MVHETLVKWPKGFCAEKIEGSNLVWREGQNGGRMLMCWTSQKNPSYGCINSTRKRSALVVITSTSPGITGGRRERHWSAKLPDECKRCPLTLYVLQYLSIKVGFTDKLFWVEGEMFSRTLKKKPRCLDSSLWDKEIAVISIIIKDPLPNLAINSIISCDFLKSIISLLIHRNVFLTSRPFLAIWNLGTGIECVDSKHVRNQITDYNYILWRCTV